MSSVKQKLCSKIGITENSLKGNNLFSTKIKPMSNGFNLDNSKLSKGEKAIKFLSNANPNIKKASLGATAYQNYKIDLLVPNSEPPKPLISLDTAKNKYSKNKFEGSYLLSPLKNATVNLTNSSRLLANTNYSNKLDTISSNLKLTSKDICSPQKYTIQVKPKNNDDFNTSKFFIINYKLKIL